MEPQSNTGKLFKSIDLIAVVGSSLLFTLLLFFVDEGNYALNGLFHKQNLGALLFYIIWIFGFTLLVQNITQKRVRKGLSLIITIVAGPLLGLVILFGIVTLISAV